MQLTLFALLFLRGVGSGAEQPRADRGRHLGQCAPGAAQLGRDQLPQRDHGRLGWPRAHAQHCDHCRPGRRHGQWKAAARCLHDVLGLAAGADRTHLRDREPGPPLDASLIVCTWAANRDMILVAMTMGIASAMYFEFALILLSITYLVEFVVAPPFLALKPFTMPNFFAKSSIVKGGTTMPMSRSVKQKKSTRLGRLSIKPTRAKRRRLPPLISVCVSRILSTMQAADGEACPISCPPNSNGADVLPGCVRDAGFRRSAAPLRRLPRARSSPADVRSNVEADALQWPARRARRVLASRPAARVLLAALDPS